MTRTHLPERLVPTDSDRAVSPVIGVVLMVAISVILAATIGTFVFGFQDKLNEGTPQADLQFEQTPTGDLEIKHTGGDPIKKSRLTVEVAGSEVTPTWPDDLYNGGDTATVSSGDVSAGDEVQVIYTDENGDTHVLREYTYR